MYECRKHGNRDEDTQSLAENFIGFPDYGTMGCLQGIAACIILARQRASSNPRRFLAGTAKGRGRAQSGALLLGVVSA